MKRRYGLSAMKELWMKSSVGHAGFFREAMIDFFGYPTGSHVEFTYYGGQWIIDYFVNVRLYWVSASGVYLQYESHWNGWRNDLRSVLSIMENHPNLRERRMELAMDGRLKDRPRIISHGMDVHNKINSAHK